MLSKSFLERREFLAAASAASFVGVAGLSSSELWSAESDVIGETDHFYYRLASAGPYVDSQRGNRAFGFSEKKVFLSEDNCLSWVHSASFPDAENITFSCLMKNGNVLFATREKLFLSIDNLATIDEVMVKNEDGSGYRPHKPKNPDQPGWYFHALDGIHTWEIDGSEILVWGNYCNVDGGPVPANIYYSIDSGRTVKIAFAFGQNPKFQMAGVERNDFFGNRANPLICRHIHAVSYNPIENAFYACTGDLERGHGLECHWLRGIYDAKGDRWDWQVLVSVDANSRFKSGGINFVDGQLYWAADANGPKPDAAKYDRGIFRCSPEDLADPSKHTLLFDPKYEVATMIVEDKCILAGLSDLSSPFATGFLVSPDLGKTWATCDLKELGKRSAYRFHPKNSDGWFRVDLRQEWIKRAEVLFIKPK